MNNKPINDNIKPDSQLRALLEHLFIEPTNNTLLQLLRYGFVGGTAFLVDYGAVALCNKVFDLPPLTAGAIGFVLGLIVNYLLSISWVFRLNRSNSALREFLFFAIIGLVGLGLNELIIHIGCNMMNVDVLIIKPISTVIVFFWNFLARKYLLFSRPQNDNQ